MDYQVITPDIKKRLDDFMDKYLKIKKITVIEDGEELLYADGDEGPPTIFKCCKLYFDDEEYEGKGCRFTLEYRGTNHIKDFLGELENPLGDYRYALCFKQLQHELRFIMMGNKMQIVSSYLD